MRRWPVGLVLWLLLLAAAQGAMLIIVGRFFVRTHHGQALDWVVLSANSIGQDRVAHPVGAILNTMSVVSLAAATAVAGFIALIRRRVAVAVGAVLLVGGANLTAQIVKHLLTRPHLGVDVERAAAGNSLPSGHTTVAASVAVALVLVLPPRARGVGAVLGAGYAALAGVATLSAGWHRPSDAVAALLIVGVWACAAQLFIVTFQGRHGGVDYGVANRYATVLLLVCGVALVGGAALALWQTDQVLATPPDQLSRGRLLLAYAGGAAGITGSASLLLATVVATVHRVVPRALSRERADRPAGAVPAGTAGHRAPAPV
jgi:membrane-associated phospholipid phosphatase